MSLFFRFSVTPLLLISALVLQHAPLRAQVPRTISYQGVLHLRSGAPVADGPHSLVLQLYATRTGKIVLYSKVAEITTAGGLFSTLLDSIPDSVAFDRQYYLGVSIDGSTELSPRTPLSAAPYALGTSTGSITSVAPKDSSIGVSAGSGPNVTIAVATSGITATKLAANSVTDSKIVSVGWAKLTGVPSGFPPNGPAGGDLQGTFPNPRLTHTSVVPGNYTNASISVDASGRITSASNGSAGGGSLTLPYSGSNASALSFEIKNSLTTADQVAIRGESHATTTSTAPYGAAILGENLNTTALTTLYGVIGRINAALNTSAGVYGFNAASGAGEGVRGYGYYGVVGVGNGLSSAAAIYGTTTNAAAYAGYFTGGLGLYTVGDQTATGTKSAIVPVGNGNWRKLYCEEAASVYFTDYGSAQLMAGRAHVLLDPTFLKTVQIDSLHPMRVFVEMNGATQGVYVLKSPTGFDVIENGNGVSNAPFDYRVVASRRGYADLRLMPGNPPLDSAPVQGQ